MQTRLSFLAISLALGGALALTAGCSSSQPSSGLWSCFDTGGQTTCMQVSALSTADRDVNGDGVPDHFVCADDDDDGHDQSRDHDQSGAAPTSGTDGDHDGIDDNLDCDQRAECESLSNDANPDRHAGEVEAEHDGGDDHGGSGGTSGSGSSGGGELHDGQTCQMPKLPTP